MDWKTAVSVPATTIGPLASSDVIRAGGAWPSGTSGASAVQVWPRSPERETVLPDAA